MHCVQTSPKKNHNHCLPFFQYFLNYPQDEQYYRQLTLLGQPEILNSSLGHTQRIKLLHKVHVFLNICLYKYIKILELCKLLASTSLHFRDCRVFWHWERERQPFSTNEGGDIAETAYQGMRNITWTHHILWERNHVSRVSRKPVVSGLSPGIFNNSHSNTYNVIYNFPYWTFLDCVRKGFPIRVGFSEDSHCSVIRRLAHVSLTPPPECQQRLDFERGQAFKMHSNGSVPSVPTVMASSKTPQIDTLDELLHGMTWTKGRVRWKEEGSLHLTVLLKLSVLEIGGSSVASQPTELRATGGFLGSFFWAGGDRGTSLDLGKRTSWSLIIMVITLWIWGVPERRKRSVELDHGKRWAVLRISTHGMSLSLALKPQGPRGPHFASHGTLLNCLR